MKIIGTNVVISAFQERCIRKLIDHVFNLPKLYDGFNMSQFCESHHEEFEPQYARRIINKHPHGCGTAACFAGHGPSAGIRPKPEEEWDDYITRVFGITQENWLSSDNSNTNSTVWRWLFGGKWSSGKNGANEAALRAQYLLDYGLPKRFQSPSTHWNRMVAEHYTVE